jgi:hypothetical protein
MSGRTRTRFRSLRIRSQSRHSERALDTYRSAYAFGAVIGIRMISLPSALNTVSKPATKLGVPLADEEPWRAPVLRQQH